MRILWHSVAPWAPSGYGQQTALFAPRVRALGHDVAISAYYGLQGSTLDLDGMRIYPSDNVFGNRLLPTYAALHDAELTITLMDLWPLKAKVQKVIDNLACWVPEDHEPAKPSTIKFLNETGARPIAMSKFGERALRDAGFNPVYVPHGINTSVFHPRPELRAKTRERLGIPESKFLIGMVAANIGRTPSRKAFPEVVQAFAEFQRHAPDAHLHFHTDPTERESGVPFGRLLIQCDIPDGSYSISDPTQVELGLAPEQMSAMYSAFDVLINPSYGEGFGLPIVEAQACGTPVIVSNFSAMPELCGAGWLVDVDRWYDAQHGSFFGRPRVESIITAMRDAYERRGDREVRKRAREFALGYDVERVTRDYWRPGLGMLRPQTRRVEAVNGLVLPEGVSA